MKKRLILTILIISILISSVSAFSLWDSANEISENLFGSITGKVFTSSSCTDSDGGKNYNEKGWVTWAYQNTMTEVDDCCMKSRATGCSDSGPLLMELYCSGEYSDSHEVYTCPGWCKDGACVSAEYAEEPGEPEFVGGPDAPEREMIQAPYQTEQRKEGIQQYKCTDSDVTSKYPDGINYYTKGIVTSDGETAEDICSGGSHGEYSERKEYVFEQFCGSRGQIKGHMQKCSIGCSNGVCVGEEAGKPEEHKRERGKEELYQKEPEIKECDGCIVNNKCINYGVRVLENNKAKYCGFDNELIQQKLISENCMNNYECESNVCIDDECVSGGFLKKLFNWFSRLFGAEEEPEKEEGDAPEKKGGDPRAEREVPGEQEVIPPTKPESIGEKINVLSSGNSNEKIDILFIPQRISDISTIPNIIDKILNNPEGSSEGTGLFNVKPFSEYKSNFNIAYINQNIDEDYFYCWLEEPDDTGAPKLYFYHGCNTQIIIQEYSVFNPDFIAILYDLPDGYQSSGGEIQRLDVDSQYIGTFVHEFGHQFGGLVDEYSFTSSPAYQCGTAEDDSCFKKYEKAVKIYPNVDVLGCPKWCDSFDVNIYKEENNICTAIQNEQECADYNMGGICTWFKTKHPYLNANCVRTQGWEDIGIGCIENTKCIFGGDYGQLAFNPLENSMMKSREGDFNKPSLDHLKNIFECCYPRIDNTLCNQFRSKFENIPDSVNHHFKIAYDKIVDCE